EQLKAIQQELGESDESQAEIDDLRRQIDEAELPEEVRTQAERELSRLERLPAAAAEHGVIRTYLEWIVSLPWSKSTEDDLDLAQNAGFRDHYLDLPFDLSRVMFITTANVLEAIPGPLRDRMEVIPLAGYTAEEKHQIAKRYLVPRQIERIGLRPEQITLRDEVIDVVITEYTREAGVRNLERELGAICRKVALEF